MPKCFKCLLIVGGLNGLHRHFKLVHKLDSFTAVYNCGESNCHVTCSSWGRLRQHLKKFHSFEANDNATSIPHPVQLPNERNNFETENLNKSHNPHVNSDHNDDISEPNEPDNNSLREQIEMFASRLVARLYAKPGRPRKVVQEFVNDVSEYLSSTISTVDKIIKSKLESANVDPIIIGEVSETLHVIENPFISNGLGTDHLRLTYLEKQGYYIKPEDCKIGSDFSSKIVDNKIVLEIDSVFEKFVPLRKVLTSFLQLPNVFFILRDYLNSAMLEGIISDFIHGSWWQAKKRYFEGKLVIPLNVFYDDYEVDKELGPHSAKLGAVYVKIASLPAEFRGSLENIFLAVLFKSSDREAFGNDAVFQKFIAEINYLQTTGLNIVVDGAEFKVYFTLGLVVADNLAMHTLLGFSEGFSANYPCRFCRVHKSEMVLQCKENRNLLRDKAEHAQDCVEGNVTNSGVTAKSVLEKIDYFETTNNPSFDIMHDLFEGVCRYDMGHILYHFIFEKKYFTTHNLNFRIIALVYGSSVSNKPNQLKEEWIRKKSLKQTASEMRTFVRVFTLLVGDLVDEADPVWHFYLILRDIVDILLSSYIQEEVLTILDMKITEHHRLYVQLFSDTLKPKHHFMVHYSTMIKRSGVPVNFSCDRFEGKHQPSIQDAKATSSRKNIAHTLAVKEQLRLANRLMHQRGLVSVLDMGRKKSCVIDPLAPMPKGFCDVTVAQYTYVNYKGTVYKEMSCVVVGLDNDGLGPQFALIDSVFINANNSVCFICHMLSVIEFASHYHAYLVSKTPIKRAIMVENLLHYLPVMYTDGFDGKQYVTVHHLL